MPRRVAEEAFVKGETVRRLTVDGLRPVRDLCVELGIVTPAWVPLWRALGVWETAGSPNALTS